MVNLGLYILDETHKLTEIHRNEPLEIISPHCVLLLFTSDMTFTMGPKVFVSSDISMQLPNIYFRKIFSISN